MFKLLNFLPLVGGIFLFILGFLTFLRLKEKKIGNIFCLFCIAVASWLIFTYFLLNSSTDEEAILWDRMLYIGVIFIPILMYHFGLAFLGIEGRQKNILIVGYLLSFIFLILSRTDYFVADLYKYSWGVHTKAQIFHTLFLLFFFAFISLYFYNLYQGLKISTGIRRLQVKYILLSFLILNIGGIAYLPAYGIDIPPFPAYLAEIIGTVILAFAILKYHLFEIRVILTEFLVVTMGVVILALPFSMPTNYLKIITTIIFILFCFVGYLLVRYTKGEAKQKEILEEMVKDRTAELERAKDIAEDRAREIEKWYHLTVGRELRMVELKEEIKKLKGIVAKIKDYSIKSSD